LNVYGEAKSNEYSRKKAYNFKSSLCTVALSSIFISHTLVSRYLSS